MPSEKLTINAVSFVHGWGPVFYAALPCVSPPSETLKHFLVSSLWDHLGAMESLLWRDCKPQNDDALPIQVVRDQLGRPHLLLGGHPGPAISFSAGDGKIWAALCGDESDIGIDLAGPDEFQRDYPFHRVFHPQELQRALRLTGGDLEIASALLWSVKEAVVKALGCAFHLIDPREVTVHPNEGRTQEVNGGHTFSVALSGKALARVPIASGRSLQVHSLPMSKLWLSIALLNLRPTGHA